MTLEQMEPLARLAWIEKLLSTISGYIYVYNATTQSNVYANRDMGYILGYSPEELREMGSALLATIMHPDDFAKLPQTIGRLMAAADDEVVEWEYRVRGRSGNWVWFQDRMTVFSRDEQGNLVEYVGSVQEVTERKQAEEEHAKLQQQIIASQEAALRELSTPLIPISSHAVVMPIIGTVDSNRTQQVLEILLTGVVERQATTVILDITGVQVVDTQVANAFIQIAQAVRLLGAQVIMTGIQPHIAQTMVHLGIDLSEVVTRRTLQEGISSALNSH